MFLCISIGKTDNNCVIGAGCVVKDYVSDNTMIVQKRETFLLRVRIFMVRGRDKFNKYKSVIYLISRFYSVFPKRIQSKALIRHRKTTGNSGLVIRYALLKNLAKSIGDNVMIQPDVYLFNVQELSIGSNVSIHPMTYIEAYGGISIGDDVSIAHGTTIMAVTHNYDDLSVPIKDQGVLGLSITIERNVWIGAKATVLGGNTIGEGGIVGAGAVITKDVTKNSVVAGVPAKIIKERNNENISCI